MKQIRLILIMACAITACLFASCTSDDVGNSNKSEKALILNGGIMSVEPIQMETRGISLTTAPMNPDSIIEGEYTLTAEETTRTPVNENNWAGIDGNRDIAVQVGDGTSPYKYSVDASGNMTSSSPHYFTTTKNVTVKSWYPYTSTAISSAGFTVQSNQSTITNLQKSDFLFGTSTTANQSNATNTITYVHKTARVIVKVVVTKTNYMLNSGVVNSVKFTGAKLESTVSTSGDMTASGSNTTTVSMYKLSSTTSNNTTTTYYVAQIPPQSATLNLTLDVGGVPYTAKMSSAKTFTAGKGNELTVNVNSSKVYIYSGNRINLGNYYCNSTSGQAWIVSKEDLPAAKSAFGVKPTSVIFSTETSTADKNKGWRLGYAMAFKDASSSAAWCTDVSQFMQNTQYRWVDILTLGLDALTAIHNYDGYSETKNITSKNNYSSTTFPAFYAAVNYPTSVPSTCSKWYLPSSGQWYLILKVFGGGTGEYYQTDGDDWGWKNSYEAVATKINSYLTGSGEEYTLFGDISTTQVVYFSSSESNQLQFPVSIRFRKVDGLSNCEFFSIPNIKTKGSRVRPVLAF
ncbi:MAG: fimbrillin family protein [Prevotella sp.]|nr:fimbrillin family protein [Prevotella sp.]